MPIVRAPRPERDFTVIRNAVINDGRLSLEARFILIYLLSKPDTWSVSTQDLINQSRDSARPSRKAVIYAALKELIDAGYLHRRRLAEGGMQYTVYDMPRSAEGDGIEAEKSSESLTSTPLSENQQVAIEPLSENQQVEASHPLSEKPLLEKPLVANRTLVKTEEVVRTETAARAERVSMVLRKPKKAKAQEIDLRGFIDGCKARGERAIPDSDPIYDWAERTKVPVEMITIAWHVFKDRHIANAKRYVDWRATFRNAVKGDWYHLWRFDGRTSECCLTVAGEQARREYMEAAA
jgi:hypothetical protein